MSDPTHIPAEDLPAAGSIGHLVGLDADNKGVLYAAMPIIAGRLRGYAAADPTLPPAAYYGYVLGFTSGTAQTFTIPTHATEPWPNFSRIHLLREGAGAVTVLAAVGVTLLAAAAPKLRANGSFATLIKISENKWCLTGDTSA